MTGKIAVEMRNIYKNFGGIIANEDISLELRQGEILALLGENGAGKSTLMNILFGLVQPDSGSIRLRGGPVRISNPAAAVRLGIGMVHQHFKLVQDFTVTENIILGQEPRKWGGIDLATAKGCISEISRTYGLEIDPASRIEDLSVGAQQRVEILKMLYRNASILIFDEPTAMLSPQETNRLMIVMKKLAAEGKSILLITHKLKEIKTVADRCTVIRRGKLIGTVAVPAIAEEQLAEMMVGRRVMLKPVKNPCTPGGTLLSVEQLTVLDQRQRPVINNVSLAVRAGEILGIAGIDGNGQSELVEAITGLRKTATGRIKIDGAEMNVMPVRRRIEAGLAHIPADRQKRGLLLDASLADNMALEIYYRKSFADGGILRQASLTQYAQTIIEQFDVRTEQGISAPARSLSGGNQQKAVIGRELSLNPKVLIAVQPTRGLDVGSIEYIHKHLLEKRDNGQAVLLISLDLDELLCLADRIVVLCDGKISGEFDASDADEVQIGLCMTGGGGEELQFANQT